MAIFGTRTVPTQGFFFALPIRGRCLLFYPHKIVFFLGEKKITCTHNKTAVLFWLQRRMTENKKRRRNNQEREGERERERERERESE